MDEYKPYWQRNYKYAMIMFLIYVAIGFVVWLIDSIFNLGIFDNLK